MKIQILVICFLLVACSSVKKSTLPTPQSRALDTMVEKKSFVLIANMASPMATGSMTAIANSGLLGIGNTASNINLTGNSNFIKIEGDTISADLPYYGEQQMGGGYVTDRGIKFIGLPEKYSITKDETTQHYDISFQARGVGNETFTIAIKLFPNWNSSVLVTSSHRNAIRYQGEVATLE